MLVIANHQLHLFYGKILLTSPAVINVQTRVILAVETKGVLFLWLAHLNNKRNVCQQMSFLFQPVTPDEGAFEMLSIPNNKSYGLYSSPIKRLKCASSICKEIWQVHSPLFGYPKYRKLLSCTEHLLLSGSLRMRKTIT